MKHSELIQASLELSATQVADILLSHHISEKLLTHFTNEPGADMWIVNRSDVYTKTLEIIARNKNSQMQKRAQQKLQLRLAPPQDLPDVLDHSKIEELDDYDIENLLGHPQVPLKAILHFFKHENVEHKTNSVLSFTRRLIEYPKLWESDDPKDKEKVLTLFKHELMNSPSNYLRAYLARIPHIFSAQEILEILKNEEHVFVKGRLLQNPSSDETALNWALNNLNESQIKSVFYTFVISSDNRLNSNQRTQIKEFSMPDLSQKSNLFILN